MFYTAHDGRTSSVLDASVTFRTGARLKLSLPMSKCRPSVPGRRDIHITLSYVTKRVTNRYFGVDLCHSFAVY